MRKPGKTNRISSRSRVNKTSLAKEYLLGHKYASDREVASAVTCSLSTVRNARRQLREEGLIGRSPYDHSSDTPLTPELETMGSRELLDELDKRQGVSGEPLTTTEKLHMLSSFARKAGIEEDSKRAIDAIRAHTTVEELTKETKDLGPAEPLTYEEKVMHTIIIFDIAGPSLAAEAALKAFEGTDLTEFCNIIGRHKATAPHSQSKNEPSASVQTAISSMESINGST